MIEFAETLLIEHVLTPQGEPELGEFRAILAGVELAIDVEAQQLDRLGVRTIPLSFEIGSGFALRHEILIGVVVQHGDRAEAERIRNRIVRDVCLRAFTARSSMAQERDLETGEELSSITWSIDWRPLRIDTPNASASVTFVLETQLDG